MNNNITSGPEWFAEWFDELYLQVYSHRNHAEAETFFANLPFWQDLAPDEWCLDLGCGAGRYSRLLSEKRYPTVGLDLSKVLLSHAQQETIKFKEHYPTFWVQADMRHIPCKSGFQLVICLFTSFGYFNSDDEHIKVLSQVANLLRTGGLVVFDLPNAGEVIEKVRHQPDTTRGTTDYSIVEKQTIEYYPLRVNKEIIITDRKKNVKQFRESVRLFQPQEIIGMFNKCGIELKYDLWGNYTGQTYSSTSPRMIYIGEKLG